MDPNAAQASASSSHPDFLSGGGEVGGYLRALDWSASTLGPPERWPQSLRTVIRLMLTTNHPVFVFWGAEHLCFYNDAYSASIGPEKHPAMLGARGREMWEEIWHIIGPQIDQVMAGGAATWHEDHLAPIIRNGRLQEVYWTYSYSPIDHADGVGGVLVLCNETTQRVLGEQRAAALMDLASRTRATDDPRVILQASSQLLCERLGVAQAGYAEIDEAEEIATYVEPWSDGRMPLLSGAMRMDDYAPAMVAELRAGRTLKVSDVVDDLRARSESAQENYAAIEVRSFVGVPLVRAGRLRAYLFIAEPGPRVWLDHEIGIIEEIARGTWDAVERRRSERAAAETLRDSEARQAFLLSLGDRLRDLDDPRAMMGATAEALGRRFGVSRAGYGELEPDGENVRFETCWTDGSVDQLVGVFPLVLFGPGNMAELARGLTTAYEDTEADPRTAGAGFAAIEARAAMVVPLVREGRLWAVLYLNDRGVRPWAAHEVSLVEEAATRTWAAVRRARAEAALRESEDRFRAVADNIPQLAWMADGEGNVDWFNRGWLDYTGTTLEQNVGAGWKAVHHPDYVDKVAAKFECHLKMGQDWEDTFPLRGKDGAYRWFLSRMNVIRDETGKVVRFFGTNTDISNERQAEERQQFLMNELAHRTKNLLTVVQAIASRSLSGTRTLAEARAVLTKRILALARSQSTLLVDGVEGVPLADTLTAELEAFSGRVQTVGPHVMLNARASQTLGLLVHELATNAIKHGALSRHGGHVAVNWSIEGTGETARFRFRWVEHGGPSVAPPTRKGFGRVVLETVAARGLGAQPKISFAPAGLEYEIEALLADIDAGRRGGPQRR